MMSGSQEELEDRISKEYQNNLIEYVVESITFLKLNRCKVGSSRDLTSEVPSRRERWAYIKVQD